MSALFEPKPRWPGGPRQCVAANLPAFDTRAELSAFKKANGPSCFVLAVWKCEACGCYHAKTAAPDPSGHTSGTTRTAKHHGDPIEV